MLVLSLFPGIDMLGDAFRVEGFCVVKGGDPIFGGDIRDEHYPAGKFDGVIGGPPCQAFSSLAHLVRANGHQPKFGNLIPEFERCVAEAQPAWFVMENVLAAPVPVVAGYGTKSFLLDNAMLESGDGFGQEQTRLRRFTFGMRGRADADVPSLMRWIDLATFVLPDATPTATQWTPDNNQEAKNGTKQRTRRQAVVSDPNAVPVKIGGSGKVKRTRQVCVTSTDGGERPSERVRSGPVTATHDSLENVTAWSRSRKKAVSGSNGGNGGGEQGRVTPGAGNNGKGRYRLAEACRLQGLPADWAEMFCKPASKGGLVPFTSEGKLKAIANGVPRFMGVAIARAVRAALADREVMG